MNSTYFLSRIYATPSILSIANKKREFSSKIHIVASYLMSEFSWKVENFLEKPEFLGKTRISCRVKKLLERQEIVGQLLFGYVMLQTRKVKEKRK